MTLQHVSCALLVWAVDLHDMVLSLTAQTSAHVQLAAVELAKAERTRALSRHRRALWQQGIQCRAPHVMFASTARAVLVIVSALLLGLLLALLPFQITCLPSSPVQHHVYYSASHIASITLTGDSGLLYATDSVRKRVIRYNSSGAVTAEWSVTEPLLTSPTSVAYSSNLDVAYGQEMLFVTDSTRTQLVKVDLQSGQQDGSALLPKPPQLWECSLVLAQSNGRVFSTWAVDRYRGYMARFIWSADDPTWRLTWTTEPVPPDLSSNINAA